jgi:hypothetical protein
VRFSFIFTFFNRFVNAQLLVVMFFVLYVLYVVVHLVCLLVLCGGGGGIAIFVFLNKLLELLRTWSINGLCE